MMKLMKVILVIAVAFKCCEASTLKLNHDEAETFQTSTESLTEMSWTESIEINTENDFSASIIDEPSTELKSDETPEVIIEDGKFFLLKMTIDDQWADDYLNRSSEVFKTLSINLGSELIDLVDNSVEATEVNTTNFRLIEVLPSIDSKLYVTFVMTSRMNIDGEKLYNAISNKIAINNEIYTYKATIEGFVLRNINKEITDELMEESEKEICDPTGEKKNRKLFVKYKQEEKNFCALIATYLV